MSISISISVSVSGVSVSCVKISVSGITRVAGSVSKLCVSVRLTVLVLL